MDQLGEGLPAPIVPQGLFQSSSVDFKGKFEISDDGLFTICRSGPPVRGLDKSETNSTRAEIDTIPDVKSLPLDEPWRDDQTGFSQEDVTPDPMSLVFGAGGWNNIPDKDMGYLFPWRLESVGLDDLQDLDLDASAPIPSMPSKPVAKHEHGPNSVPLSVSRWVRGQYSTSSVTASSESVPALTEDCSRDSDSFVLPDGAFIREDFSRDPDNIVLPYGPVLHKENFSGESDNIVSPDGAFIREDIVQDLSRRPESSTMPKYPDSILTHIEFCGETSNLPHAKFDGGGSFFGNASADFIRQDESPTCNDQFITPHINSADDTDDSLEDAESVWMSDYSETFPILESSHPFLRVKSEVVMNVLRAFEPWSLNYANKSNSPQDGQDGMETQGGPSSSAVEPSRAAPASQNSQRKRALPEARKEDDADEGDGKDEGPSKKRNRVSRQAAARELSLACPFAKKDPIKYRGCYQYTLRRTHHVKQHLSRCHQLPIYCQRCKELFETEEERDEHATANALCEKRFGIRYEGLTRKQKEQLGHRVSPKMTLSDQWFTIFDILFPGHTPRPASAFVNPSLTEELEAFQDMMNIEGPAIIISTLDARGIRLSSITNEEHDLSTLLRIAVIEGLQAIAQRWTASLDQGSTGLAENFGNGSVFSSANAGSEQSHGSSDTLVNNEATNTDSLLSSASFNGAASASRAQGSSVVSDTELTIRPFDNRESALPNTEETTRTSRDQLQLVLSDPQHDNYVQGHGTSEPSHTIGNGEADGAGYSYQVDEELDGNMMKTLFDNVPEFEWVNM